MHKRTKIDLPLGKITGIYIIRNIKNGKAYVGSAVNIRKAKGPSAAAATVSP